MLPEILCSTKVDQGSGAADCAKCYRWSESRYNGHLHLRNDFGVSKQWATLVGETGEEGRGRVQRPMSGSTRQQAAHALETPMTHGHRRFVIGGIVHLRQATFNEQMPSELIFQFRPSM